MLISRQKPGIRILNLVAPWQGIPEIIGGNSLLRKRPEGSGAFRLAQVNHYSAVLPNVIVIVVVIPAVVHKTEAT
jgi:hypothetical protein